MDRNGFVVPSSVQNNNSLHAAAPASFRRSLSAPGVIIAQKRHVGRRARRKRRVLARGGANVRKTREAALSVVSKNGGGETRVGGDWRTSHHSRDLRAAAPPAPPPLASLTLVRREASTDLSSDGPVLNVSAS